MLPRIILVTSGIPNDKSRVKEIVKQIGNLDSPIPLVCICFPGCDAELMKFIAKKTRGVSLFPQEIQELPQLLYKQLLLTLFVIESRESLENIHDADVLRQFLESKAVRFDREELAQYSQLLHSLVSRNPQPSFQSKEKIKLFHHSSLGHHQHSVISIPIAFQTAQHRDISPDLNSSYTDNTSSSISISNYAPASSRPVSIHAANYYQISESTARYPAPSSVVSSGNAPPEFSVAAKRPGPFPDASPEKIDKTGKKTRESKLRNVAMLNPSVKRSRAFFAALALLILFFVLAVVAAIVLINIY